MKLVQLFRRTVFLQYLETSRYIKEFLRIFLIVLNSEWKMPKTMIIFKRFYKF